jgi:hypothetical protein
MAVETEGDNDEVSALAAVDVDEEEEEAEEDSTAADDDDDGADTEPAALVVPDDCTGTDVDEDDDEEAGRSEDLEVGSACVSACLPPSAPCAEARSLRRPHKEKRRDR